MVLSGIVGAGGDIIYIPDYVWSLVPLGVFRGCDVESWNMVFDLGLGEFLLSRVRFLGW